MQPLRIDELAYRIAEDAGYVAVNDATLGQFRIVAESYAAIVLGGSPTVTVEHGVKHVGGGVQGPYDVPQEVPFQYYRQVTRERWVYPAAAFVTKWKEAP